MSDTAPGNEPTYRKPRWSDDLQPSEITALVGGWLDHKVAPVPAPLRTAAKVTMGLAAAVAFLVVADIVVAPFIFLALGVGVGAAESAAISFLALGSYLALGDARHQQHRAEYNEYVASIGQSASTLDGTRPDLSEPADAVQVTTPDVSDVATVADVQDTPTPETSEAMVAAPTTEARRDAKKRMAAQAKRSGTRAVPVATEAAAPAAPDVAARASQPTPTARPEAAPAPDAGPAPDAAPTPYHGRHSAPGPSADTSLG